MSNDVKYCPDCGAYNLAQAEKCFLCSRELKSVKPSEIILAELVEQRPSHAPAEMIFAILTLLLVGFLLLVGIGLAQENAGSAFVYSLFVLPGIVIAGIGVLNRRSRGKPAGFGRALVVIILSWVVSAAVAALLIAAAFVTLFFMCLSAMSGGGIR